MRPGNNNQQRGRGFARGRRPSNGGRGRGGGGFEFRQEPDDQLPSVDDLEVAAAAALAVPADQTFTSPHSTFDADRVQRLRAQAAAACSSDEEDEESSSDEEMEVAPAEEEDEAAAAPAVSVALVPDGETVKVLLSVREPEEATNMWSAAALPTKQLADMALPPGMEIISDSEDEDHDTEMKVLLDQMVAGSDHEDEPKGGIDPEVVPPLQVEVITILPEDTLLPAGKVSAIVEGMLVVQVRELMRPLDIESVLCTAERQPLGRVEEIFGPVAKPLYALRYTGPGKAEDLVQPGSQVFAVESAAKYVNTAEAQQTDRRDYVAAAGPEEEEEYFSDDEQELQWRRQHSKRPSEGAAPSSRSAKFSGTSPARGRGRGGGGRGRSSAPQGFDSPAAAGPQAAWQQQQPQHHQQQQFAGEQQQYGYQSQGGRGPPHQQRSGNVQFHQQQQWAGNGQQAYQQQYSGSSGPQHGGNGQHVQQQYASPGPQFGGGQQQYQQQGYYSPQGVPMQQMAYQVPPGMQLVPISSGQLGPQLSPGQLGMLQAPQHVIIPGHGLVQVQQGGGRGAPPPGQPGTSAPGSSVYQSGI